MTTEQIAAKAAEIIFANEGNYGSVNKNDNGAISIGKVQWHGNRALSLLRSILAKDLKAAGQILSSELYFEIMDVKTNWGSRIVSTAEATPISKLLSTAIGKAEQDALAIKDITGYITKGMSYGLKDPGALIYFADGVNQYGSNSSLWKTITTDALKSTGDVEAMYAATVKHTTKYLTRRETVYKKVKTLNLGGGNTVQGIELKGGVGTYSAASDGAKTILLNGKATNFKISEFKCKDGSDNILIDRGLVQILQAAREHFGKSVNINSAYRTAAYNQKVGGASSSYHTKGQAADITISGIANAEVAQYFEGYGANGIGFYNYSGGFVHVDTRTQKYLWQQDSKNTPYYKVETFSITLNFVTGTYELSTTMKVRTGPGTSYPAKSKKELTENGQRNANTNGTLKPGTKVTVKKVFVNGSEYWALTPSGYIAMKMGNEIYMKKA